jgi:hypothetical protein
MLVFARELSSILEVGLSIDQMVPGGLANPNVRYSLSLPSIAYSLTQQGFEVPATPNHMENQNMLCFDAVHNNVLAHGKTPQAGP